MGGRAYKVHTCIHIAYHTIPYSAHLKFTIPYSAHFTFNCTLVYGIAFTWMSYALVHTW